MQREEPVKRVILVGVGSEILAVLQSKVDISIGCEAVGNELYAQRV